MNRRGHPGFACIWNIVKYSFCFIFPQVCHVLAIKSWNIKACSDATWTDPLWRHRLICTHRPVKYKLLVSITVRMRTEDLKTSSCHAATFQHGCRRRESVVASYPAEKFELSMKWEWPLAVTSLMAACCYFFLLSLIYWLLPADEGCAVWCCTGLKLSWP